MADEKSPEERDPEANARGGEGRPARWLDEQVPGLANPVLDCIENRRSTRSYSDEPITDEERRAILHAASRAPSAGAMMFYSIVEVDDPEKRAALLHACDDQPFMRKAPLWLLFVADVRKWYDLYDHAGCHDDASLASFPENARRSPGLGDLLLASQDAMCAAQTAVIAAESLGIGSCYIGDCIEHGERVAELLNLPSGTVPLSLLVFGHKKPARPGEVSVSCTVDDEPASADAGARPDPRAARTQTPHPVANLFMRDGYHRADAAELDAQVAELDEKFTPHAVANGAPAGERVRKLYHRKHTSDFMAEMNRSAAWWLENWEAASPRG